MFTRYLVALCVITLSGCTTPIREVPVTSVSTGTGIVVLPPTDTTVVWSGAEQDIMLDVIDGTGTLTIVKWARAKVRVHFLSSTAKSLTVHLDTPGDTKANVRVSQIVMPDGTSDGPFGRDMTYSLTQTGEYQLIISESLMAGDPWAGRVDVTVGLR